MLRVGQQLFQYITRDKNILYVFCNASIGDFLIVGGLCHALLKKKRKQTCSLILNERYIKNADLINFVGVTEIIYFPPLLDSLIDGYVHATRQYETDNYIHGYFKKDQNGLIQNENLSFVDRYKENVFGLPLDTEVLPPLITPLSDYQKQRLHEAYVLDKERTIILAPHSLTAAIFEEAFWLKLISELKQKNKDYIFYTNVAYPHEKVISGTAPIVTTFPELIYLAEKVNCFIGLRSGIFDLLAFTNAKLLYINRDIKDWWFFDLKLNFNHSNSRPFYLLSPPEQEVLRVFMQQNNLTSIDNLQFMNRVMGSDSSLDLNSLIEKIVSAVD